MAAFALATAAGVNGLDEGQCAGASFIGCFGLTEPDHGSDPANISTRARRDGDDWVLDGSKMWITKAPVADVAVTWARAEEGVVGFAVPTDSPCFAAREIKHMMSPPTSPTGEITLDGGGLPEDARLSEARGLKAPLSCLTEARFDPSRSWALAAVHMASAPTRTASVILAWCAAGLYVAAGLAFAVDTPVSAGLAALAALVGLVLKGLWFNPWLSLGVALDVGVLGAVLAG